MTSVIWEMFKYFILDTGICLNSKKAPILNSYILSHKKIKTKKKNLFIPKINQSGYEEPSITQNTKYILLYFPSTRKKHSRPIWRDASASQGFFLVRHRFLPAAALSRPFLQLLPALFLARLLLVSLKEPFGKGL